MGRTPQAGAGGGQRVFDGRRARSALKWRILGTLLGRVVAPVAAAEIYEYLRRSSSRSFSQWVHRLMRPSSVYLYLYRMAEDGLLHLHRLGERLEATLTEEGRRELERYAAYWKERGVRSPEQLAERNLARGSEQAAAAGTRPGRGHGAGTGEPGEGPETGAGAGPDSGQRTSGHGDGAEERPTPSKSDGRSVAAARAAAPRGKRVEAAGGSGERRAGASTLAARCRALVQRRLHTRRGAGFGGSDGFVSYDLPVGEEFRRRHILGVLRAAGFSRLHHSMYVGPGAALGAVVSTLEGAGLVPHLRWGSLRLLKR